MKLLTGSSHLDACKIFREVIALVKKSQTYKDLCNKYNVEDDYIDLVPMAFAELDVSARTEHGIIYLNVDLLKKRDEIAHYLIHEFDHVLQQTTGDGPTKGSTDNDYLDNEFEREGFNEQSKYISETRGDGAAKKYIERVLKHHDVPKKERSQRKQDLLQLAADVRVEKAMQAQATSAKQIKLMLDESPEQRTKEEMMADYDAAVARGPQESHMRSQLHKVVMAPRTREYLIKQLRKILKLLENPSMDPVVKARLDHKKELLQLALKLDE